MVVTPAIQCMYMNLTVLLGQVDGDSYRTGNHKVPLVHLMKMIGSAG